MLFHSFVASKLFFMRIIFFILGLFMILSVQAQDIDSSYIYIPAKKPADTVGNVHYFQSSAIVSIMNKKIIVNETHPKVSGYRIQVFSVSGVNSKDKINKEKAEYMLNNKSAIIYIVYQSPYFKLRIGDYRSKLQAYFYLQEIIKDYPFAFIVKDEVNIPNVLKEEGRNPKL